MNEKKPWLVDIAVLCIFFARPDVFRQCFERVREIRPRQLLLWQDGPRAGRQDDAENIRRCREIASNIDWDCEVFTNYHDTNIGCDPSTHLSHKWAFSIVDKCIVLEDDIVPHHTFFTFCKDMLDKYENDTRIDRICGMNVVGVYPGENDYFFCRYGNSWGWASWRRVAQTWETEYDFLDDPEAIHLMEGVSRDVNTQRDWIKMCKQRRSTGKAFWEFIVGARTLLQSGLVIYPRKNMICNVGVGLNSTHAPESVEQIDETTRKLFMAPTYEMPANLKHPKYIIPDEYYMDACRRAITPSFSVKWKARLKRLTLHNVLRKLGLK